MSGLPIASYTHPLALPDWPWPCLISQSTSGKHRALKLLWWMAGLPPSSKPYAIMAHILRKDCTANASRWGELTPPESFGPAKLQWKWQHEWFFYSSACQDETGHDEDEEGYAGKLWDSTVASLAKVKVCCCCKVLEKQSAIATTFMVILLILIMASGYGTFSSLKSSTHS